MSEPIHPSLDGGVHHCLLHASTRLQTVLFLVKRYVCMNLYINPCDTFAVILFNDKATWHLDFTDDVAKFTAALEDIGVKAGPDVKLDTDSLFRTIEDQSVLSDDRLFTHAIIFYGRSNSVPSPLHRDFHWMRNCPNFTFDLVFLHGPIATNKHCQAVFDFWCGLSCKAVPGWFFEFTPTCRSSLTKTMAQLVAHPMQRGNQDKMAQVIPVDTDQQERQKEEQVICLSD